MRTLVNPVVKQFIENLVLANSHLTQVAKDNTENSEEGYSVVVAVSPRMFQTLSAYQKFKEDLASVIKGNEQDETNSSNSSTSQKTVSKNIDGTTPPSQTVANQVGKQAPEQAQTQNDDEQTQTLEDLEKSLKKAPSELSPDTILRDEKQIQNFKNSNPHLEDAQNRDEKKTHLNFFQKIKLHAQLSNITRRAQNVFPTSYLFESFMARANQAYEQGNLKDVKFALETFENLKALNTSKVYSQAVNSVSQNPQFSSFVDILNSMSSPYQQSPTLQATKEFQSAVESESINQNETKNNRIIEQISEEVKMPKALDLSGKVVVHEGSAEEKTGFTIVTDMSKYVSEGAVAAAEKLQHELESAPQETVTQADANNLENLINSIEAPTPVQDVEGPLGLTGEVNTPTASTNSQVSNDASADVINATEQATEAVAELQEEMQRQIIRQQQEEMEQ